VRARAEASRLTPVSDAPRMYADLSLYLGDFEPEAVTSLLGVAPDRILVKGVVDGPGGSPSPEGVWQLGSRGRVDGASPEAHTARVLDALAPGAERLRALMAERGDMAATLWVYWLQVVPRAGFALSPLLTGRIGSLPADLAVGVYTHAVERPEAAGEVEDEIHVAGYAADGTLVLASRGRVGGDAPSDHLRWVLGERERTGSELARVVVTWLRRSDNTTLRLVSDLLAELGRLDVGLELVLGVPTRA
jgi:hypothetical protein